MRVLHVNDYRSAGGCEVLIETTMELLRDVGVESSLFTSEDIPGHRRTALRYISNHVAARALADRIEALKPDVVHLHNFYHELSPSILTALGDAGRDRLFRVVMTAHDFHLICPNSGLCTAVAGTIRPVDVASLVGWSDLFRHRWDERGLAFSAMKLLQHLWNYRWHDRRRAIDVVICPSHFVQRALEQFGLPTVLVPNPVHRDADQEAGSVHRPADTLRWVFAGRVEPEKGIDDFLRLLPADFSGHLTIVGAGQDMDRCRTTCRNRGLEGRVDFIGQQPPREARLAIASSHVLILPSLCSENAPLSLLEALATGTNILVSNYGGMREIVEAAGVGFTFAPGDADSLVSAIGDITRRFEDGTLNAFDVSAFLSSRDERSYVRRTLSVYRGEYGDPAAPPGASGVASPEAER